MGNTLLSVLLFHLLNTLLYYGHAQVPDAVLKIDPNWSTFYIGESVIFICDMKERFVVDWVYKINKDGRDYVPYAVYERYTFGPLSTDDSGVYQCVGRRRSSFSTKSSNTVSLTVSAKPKATLTADTTTIPVGGSVTLTCSVQNSDGWKYEYYRFTQGSSPVLVNPVTTNDEQNRVISVSQEGLYWCRGGRGEPVYYTFDSKGVIIETALTSNEAVLRRQPDWTQMFRGERITLTCEVNGGETIQWMYDWRGPGLNVYWKNANYLTLNVSESSSGDYMCRSRLRDDSYSLTEWSKAVTLSVSDKPKALLNADVRDIPVGGSVTLICSVNPSSGWKYYWYRDEKLSHPLTSQDAVFPSNGQISVSEGGLYRCRGGRGNPVYSTEYSDPVTIRKNADKPKAVLTVSPSWLSPGASVNLSCEVEHPSAGWRFYWYQTVPDLSGTSYSYELLPGSINGTEQDSYIIDGQTQTAGYACRAGRGDPEYHTDYSKPTFVWSGGSSPESSSFTVPLIIGLVSGIFLTVIVGLLLLCCCRQIKDPHCNRLSQSQNMNQASVTLQTVNQNETQTYSSLLQGDAAAYETIRCSGNSGSDEPASSYTNVTST